MSPLETDMSKAGSLNLGNDRTQGGLSHSCERPTRNLPASSAQTISVALANNETILIYIAADWSAEPRGAAHRSLRSHCSDCRNLPEVCLPIALAADAG